MGFFELNTTGLLFLSDIGIIAMNRDDPVLVAGCSALAVIALLMVLQRPRKKPSI